MECARSASLGRVRVRLDHGRAAAGNAPQAAEAGCSGAAKQPVRVRAAGERRPQNPLERTLPERRLVIGLRSARSWGG